MEFTGDYYGSMRNRMTIYAHTNPAPTDREPVELHERMAWPDHQINLGTRSQCPAPLRMAAWMRDGNESRDRLLDGIHNVVQHVLQRTGPSHRERTLWQRCDHRGEYRMRVFPAIPTDWKDVRFDNLLTEGGFVVSAALQGGQLQVCENPQQGGQAVSHRGTLRWRSIRDRNASLHE